MSHRFFQGDIFHKRFFPKIHQFTYDYFFIDIDLTDLSSLENRLFKLNRLGVMSFFAQDHFGHTDDFYTNAKELIQALGWTDYAHIRFLTLPRILNFVFNPISLILLLDEHGSPTHCIAEVHNYNDGRALYPMKLEELGGYWIGKVEKSMYVSPFMGYEGTYRFRLYYTAESFELWIELSEGSKRMLIADFKGTSLSYSTKSIRTLLCDHTLLSFFVVTRTLWQTLLLKFKGLTWHSPRPQDQQHKELT